MSEPTMPLTAERRIYGMAGQSAAHRREPEPDATRPPEPPFYRHQLIARWFRCVRTGAVE
jgi:hypothetical protein